jgi:G5 domain/Transglycosylase-like domain/G5-linked-Ubiquitin-like domain
VPGSCAVGSQMQRHHARQPDVRGRAGGVAVLATRALVVTALVGGTGAYLHADVTSGGGSATQGAERFSAAALHEPATLESNSVPTVVPLPSPTSTPGGESEPATANVVTRVAGHPATLVHVFHDGCSTPVLTTARTVSAALSQAKVTVAANDIVRPGRTTSPKPGMSIHVVRVRIRIEHVRVAVAFATLRKADPTLARGHSKIVTKGVHGVDRLTYKVVLHDGKVASKSMRHRVVVKAPVTEVVHYGTKRAQAASRGKRSVDSLNWHALAECESHDNPKAVGGHGKYFGLYQFTVGTWHSVGGTGNPVNASRAEQTQRAEMLYT